MPPDDKRNIEAEVAGLAALEEVQVNVTGEGGVSTEATLAALLAILTPGTPEQHVGTADVAMQTVTFSGPTLVTCFSMDNLTSKLRRFFRYSSAPGICASESRGAWKWNVSRSMKTSKPIRSERRFRSAQSVSFPWAT
ncbi:MAG: hypothetical protein ACYTKD_08770 [Planctomycetota bacterium]|jgi:hypothetical protein